MKKIFCCVISLIVLFSTMTLCYAGDIPESLLSDDNNPVYIWEVTSFDTNTLEIKNDDTMSQRMQEYLNSGDFAEKEQDRVTDIDKSKATLSLGYCKL